MSSSDLLRVEAKLDAIAARLDAIAARQERMDELLEDAGPILKDVVRVATERLSGLERRGYFAFAKEMGEALDRVVTSYGPEEVRRFAESVVGILDTVRSLTQPDMLEIVNQARGVVLDAGKYAPVGVVGVMKAAREDEVKKGLAVSLELLRQIGKGSEVYARGRERPRLARVERTLAPKIAPTKGPPPPPPADEPEIDPAAWTKETGAATALTLGIAMSEAHWKVVEVARADFMERKASPNVRRLTKLAELSTKELYTLFPRAPGKTISQIAGIPKPVGCI